MCNINSHYMKMPGKCYTNGNDDFKTKDLIKSYFDIISLFYFSI